jgi:hypothetical protein
MITDAFKHELDALGAQLDASAALISAARHVATSLSTALLSVPAVQVERDELHPLLLARLRSTRKKTPRFQFFTTSSSSSSSSASAASVKLHVVDATSRGVVRLVFALPRERRENFTKFFLFIQLFCFFQKRVCLNRVTVNRCDTTNASSTLHSCAQHCVNRQVLQFH